MDIVKILSKVAVFAGVSEQGLGELGRTAAERSYRKGEIIVSEGALGNAFYVLISGEVEVLKGVGSDRETLLSTLKGPDFFGEMCIVESCARTASVRALGEVELISLKGTDLYHLFQKYPEQYAIVILNIARDLSRRLRKLDILFAARAD